MSGLITIPLHVQANLLEFCASSVFVHRLAFVVVVILGFLGTFWGEKKTPEGEGVLQLMVFVCGNAVRSCLSYLPLISSLEFACFGQCLRPFVSLSLAVLILILSSPQRYCSSVL